jgi:hypothetical protein
MYRVIVLYAEAPEAASYEEHADVCRRVPNGVFRYGKVTGAPLGEPAHAFYAEWEFADKDAFESAIRSEEFMATGKDAYKRGYPMPSVEFAEIS